jgi:cytochrome c553
MSHRRPTSIALGIVCASVLLTAGCGGGERDSAAWKGAALFNDAGCAGCHTFVAAGARARVGPDLDLARPAYADVARRVRHGGSGMPAFAGELTDREIATLATFVSRSAATGSNPAVLTASARFTPDETSLSDCTGDFRCLEQAFGNIAFRRGERRALAQLERSAATKAAVEGDCHRIAHVVGAAALERHHGRAAQALVAGSAICSSGYYHGIAERAFSGLDADELPAASRRLCSDASIRRTAFLAYQCLHGLGHGLMISTGYDLPVALRVCDRLGTAWDRTSCTGGVFMENVTSSYGVRSRWLRDDDPIYPCDAVERRHKLYCYLMVTSRILPLVGYDFVRTAAVCRRSETEWISTCFESYGRDASGQSHGDVRRILVLCGYARGYAGACLYGAARDLVNTDAATGRAAALCGRATQARGRCFEAIGTIVGDLHRSAADRRAACRSVSRLARYRNACLAGAGVIAA